MAKLFNGKARQIAIIPIVLSGIGWIIYAVGFGLECRNRGTLLIGPDYYPWWAVNTITPAVLLGALIHAALWGMLSSIVGAVTVFLSVTALTAMGFLLYNTGLSIFEDTTTGSYWIYLQFGGVLMSGVFWAIAFSLWPFYRYKETVYRTDMHNDELFHGMVRKTTIPLLTLSALGWLLLMVGLGLEVSKTVGVPVPVNTTELSQFPTDYPYWVSCLYGPLVYCGAFAHAALWKWQSSAVGAFTAVLSTVHFTAIGSLMHFYGNIIYHNILPDIEYWIVVQFTGALISCFFWALEIAMWPFFSNLESLSSRYVSLQNF